MKVQARGAASAHLRRAVSTPRLDLEGASADVRGLWPRSASLPVAVGAGLRVSGVCQGPGPQQAHSQIAMGRDDDKNVFQSSITFGDGSTLDHQGQTLEMDSFIDSFMEIKKIKIRILELLGGRA
ncbi:hypothetical protein TREES_T100006823 [Tupaia chinensis]|uniref:Uncharacterized protein n=1 Tax=Tupaia chinensis TaxID=246437 RepID=L9JA43_TUPCH|nr:hypothetical protein TREES_T100006823 [Tupaia chinensis]